MGLSKFKKLFIEDEADALADVQEYLQSQGLQSTPEVQVSDIEIKCDASELVSIATIYEENELVDYESSIYKVDQIRNVLPKDLPKEAKKESVLGMMQVTGLSLDIVLADAEIRKNILTTVDEKFNNETNKIIENSTNEIAELEERINTLKSIITERKKTQEQQSEILSNEFDKIDEIIKFIK